MALNLFVPSAPSHEIAGYAQFSPLMLADSLLTLAQKADRAGYRDSASRLLGVMHEVLDGRAGPQANDARS
ncbi:MAG: hypothetical protein JOZ05_25060 [Acetobacteraceae bacterium]|nr:hypothetical protein [Acetobacteraceae bacterium]